MTTTVWWLRRDLRLGDNPALTEAAGRGQVLPVFVLDPALLAGRWASERRQAFLFGGLRALGEQLRQHGGQLVVRQGKPAEVLADLQQATGAAAVVAQADFSPYARRRDAAVGRVLPLELVGGSHLRHPRDVVKADGSPYTVYTPYMKAWRTAGLPRLTDVLQAPKDVAWVAEIASEEVPKTSHGEAFPPSEEEAQRRLAAFVETGLGQYRLRRDQMAEAGTSGLSPYLRFGMLSVRQVIASAVAAMQQAVTGEAQAAAESWLNELIWREFYSAILYHFPGVLREAFRPGLRTVRWENAPEMLAAWQAGQTGYPVVDAGMRQLLASGWMHNRARMLTASFLVKNLLVDWRLGEAWFMRQLIDGDPAANNGGWQWSAGTGTDASPYFRVFNPVLQGRKFDAQGDYVRRWVPELSNVPDRYIHAPWEMPANVQLPAGCIVGKDYPAPIVDLATSRQRALAAYSAAKLKQKTPD